jgi:hypothetical protein
MPQINIFKIVFDNDINEYIGATKMKLSLRKASFRNDMKKIYGDNVENMTDFYKNIYNNVNNKISLIEKLEYTNKKDIDNFINNLVKNNNNYKKITSKKSVITHNWKEYMNKKNKEYKSNRENQILEKLNDEMKNKIFEYMMNELGKDKIIRKIQNEYLSVI